MPRFSVRALLALFACLCLALPQAANARPKPARHVAAAKHAHRGHAAARASTRRRGKAAKPPLKTARAMHEDEAPKAYASCSDAPATFVRASEANAKSLDTLDWSPFGVPETGWQVYALLVSHEIGASCSAGTPKFAEALAAFQAKYQLPANGVFTPATFEVVKGLLQERRSFVMERLKGICPDAPQDSQLIAVPKDAETFGREDRRIRSDVWEAYERMVAAARAELPSLKGDPQALTIFSAYRSPEGDAARCDAQGNCDGLRRAACSSHRTGAAIDLNVGWIPGVAADSTTPENRLLQTRTAPYEWLVNNASRFGFVNYPYEPWHWEWVGDAAKATGEAAAVVAPARSASPTPTLAAAPPTAGAN